MTIRAFISGCSGLSLSSDEVAFFKKFQPWGLILFKRNCDTPAQIKALTKQFRDAVERRDAPVFIDQEGGRVQRLGPPHWPRYPQARAFGELYQRNATLAVRTARNIGRLMAKDLYDLDITSSCLPVLDVPQAGAHDVIGNRAYDLRPEAIVILANAHTSGLLDGGVLPVMKHIPGHGRSMVDSHYDLPVVKTKRMELEIVDFFPFAALANMPMAMTAHVVYEALDAENPATLSRKIIRDVVRKVIGFQGLLMTDDLSMKALGGSMEEKVARAYDAGCDMVLHCNGVFDEMQAVGSAATLLSAKTARRAKAALKMRRKPLAFDEKQAMRDLEAILGT